MEEARVKIGSTGQEEEQPQPDMNLETQTVDDVPTGIVSRSIKNGHGTVEDATNSSMQREPPKFDFHFPEEVWEIILNMLTEDEDRTNCCRAFPIFDQILTRSKPVWLFKQIFPLVDYKMGKRDILTSRLTCKQWCSDIDHSIIQFPAFLFDGAKKWYYFDCLEKINRFNLTFEGHSGNPFVSRSIAIQDYLGEDAAEFQSRLLDLLSNFGEHIWELEFHWASPSVTFRYDNNDFWMDSYRFLKQVLIRTPNLKTFRFWGNPNAFPGIARSVYFRLLSLHMTDNPLPPIPTLETLDIWTLTTDELPMSFINILVLPYASHLQSIRLNRSREMFGQLFSFQLPKLAHIKIDDALNDRSLEQLLLLTAPLKKLEIDGIHPFKEDYTSFNISTFHRVFQNFNLLEEVEITGCYVEAPVGISHLGNSTVRKLTLTWNWKYCRLPTSFNFLQVFKALEELHVDLSLPREDYLGRNEGWQDVQFYRMLENDQLYESNIWWLIPTLKSVCVICNSDWRMGKVDGNRKEFLKHQAGRLRVQN